MLHTSLFTVLKSAINLIVTYLVRALTIKFSLYKLNYVDINKYSKLKIKQYLNIRSSHLFVPYSQYLGCRFDMNAIVFQQPREE